MENQKPGAGGVTGLVGLNQPAAINKSESLKMQLPVNGKKASERSNRKKTFWRRQKNWKYSLKNTLLDIYKFKLDL